MTAIDFCSESPSLGTSPRISFSHDIHHLTDHVSSIENYPSRSDSSLLDSNSEFNFWVGKIAGDEPSSADELFSDGFIRPLQIQESFVIRKANSSIKPKAKALPPLPFPASTDSEALKQEITNEAKPQKSFWQIRRSTSLHCDNNDKKSSFWSLPLLLRSNSTGSVPTSSKQKQSLQKQKKQLFASSSSSSSCSSYASSLNSYSFSQKPPLKKNYGGGGGWSYGNGSIRISPVLNVPPPYFSSNLFGLGSLFRNGKDKKNKK